MKQYLLDGILRVSSCNGPRPTFRLRDNPAGLMRFFCGTKIQPPPSAATIARLLEYKDDSVWDESEQWQALPLTLMKTGFAVSTSGLGKNRVPSERPTCRELVMRGMAVLLLPPSHSGDRIS